VLRGTLASSMGVRGTDGDRKTFWSWALASSCAVAVGRK
jgi:hypothetical protein